MVPVPPLQGERSAGDGAGQRSRPARRAGRRGPTLVRRDHGKEPDRDCDRQALVQHGHRAPERHFRHGNVRAEALLRHRGVARGRQGVPGKTQARFSPVRAIAIRTNGRKQADATVQGGQDSPGRWCAGGAAGRIDPGGHRRRRRGHSVGLRRSRVPGRDGRQRHRQEYSR